MAEVLIAPLRPAAELSEQQLAQVLSLCDREQIEALVETGIALLDDMDGDLDLEDDDVDEESDPAGQCDEDGVNCGMVYPDGPGCPLADGIERNDVPVGLVCQLEDA